MVRERIEVEKRRGGGMLERKGKQEKNMAEKEPNRG